MCSCSVNCDVVFSGEESVWLYSYAMVISGFYSALIGCTQFQFLSFNECFGTVMC